ncbi:hypothetical protein [Streptomyces sp. NPDC002790]|uniref:hypothetical protein n=1 Tax=Streptomyces sp. NPDC002790 TaxID=3154431 RepID=UPI003317A227
MRTSTGEYTSRNNSTYWFGWDSMTKTSNAQTVYPWKSNGTNDQNTNSAGQGTLSVYKDGSRADAQTWDDLGNKPRWGTHFGADTSTASINWIAGLKMGTSRGDID